MHTAASRNVDADQDRSSLPRDGERFLPDMRGRIAAEHLLRYHWAASLVGDRDVLDIACGEGYGSHLLAERARRVVGADVAALAVEHAQLSYRRDNLTYDIADITKLPYPDDSFDVITCFETIEHVDQVQTALVELDRVLRPDGILLISTPNVEIYSNKYGYSNRFHKKEMNVEEFSALLSRHFPVVRMAGQASSFASLIAALPSSDTRSDTGSTIAVLPYQADQLERSAVIQYFVAVCSVKDIEVPVDSALYFDVSDDSNIVAEMAAVHAALKTQMSPSSDSTASADHVAKPLTFDGEDEARANEVKYYDLMSRYETMRQEHDLLRDRRRIEQAQREAEIGDLRGEFARHIESTTLQFKQLQAEHCNLWKLNNGLRLAKVAAESTRDVVTAQCAQDLDVMRLHAHSLTDKLFHLQSYVSTLAARSEAASTSGTSPGTAVAHLDGVLDPQTDTSPLPGFAIAPPGIKSMLAPYVGRARWRTLLTRYAGRT